MIRACKITFTRGAGLERTATALTPMIWAAANRILYDWCLEAPYAVHYEITYDNDVRYRGTFELAHYTAKMPDLTKEITELMPRYQVGDT